MDNNKLKVLFVASEVSPYVKSGGLGDVAGSLPKALQALGVDVRVVFPKYGTINEAGLENLRHIGTMAVQLDWRQPQADIYTFDAPYPIYLIKNDYYFNRGHLYGFGDDYERFAFFSKAAIGLLAAIDFQADIIHFSDWQTGLGCVYLKDIYSKFMFYDKTKSLFTIHNLQYQGNFGRDVLPQVDLNDGYFVSDKLEFYGNASYMKAGLAYADHISTVSRTYAAEIQTPRYGYGMEGMLKSRDHELTGILNGLDYEENNPATDPRIFANYSTKDPAKKAVNKQMVQELLGLPLNPDVPIFAIVSRLAEQKGLDLIAGCMQDLARRDLQLVILGTGNQHYEHLFTNIAYFCPDKISANIMFDGDLAQKIYAAADFFLMPSLFEPCGLGQLIAMRYGALPIVRKTGGLADTISHYDYVTRQGCGLVFEDYLASGLLWAVDEALHLYANQEHFKAARKNAMKADFSWTASAKEYVELYNRIKNPSKI
ncbi:MAG: glycogen synthase GlgA [Defluviitaleaceae bacterium]|nr:glycogen synthase GlgA [Defluviitaleaceae bacterium]